MPSDNKPITIPDNVSRETFLRLVMERVWQLWRREQEQEDERQGKRQRR